MLNLTMNEFQELRRIEDFIMFPSQSNPPENLLSIKKIW